MTTPDRPSAEAIAQAFVDASHGTSEHLLRDAFIDDVMRRARELDAARPAEAATPDVRNLPPLPPMECGPHTGHVATYTAEQMRDYAADAIRLSHTWPPLRDDAALSAPAAPGGEWVMVPRVPTANMLDYGIGAQHRLDGDEGYMGWADAIYRAMIDAAPAAPACPTPRGPGGREVVVAELIAADLEYDAAEVAWDALDTRDGLGDDRDGRDYDGPEYDRLCKAISRRSKALQAATGGEVGNG